MQAVEFRLSRVRIQGGGSQGLTFSTYSSVNRWNMHLPNVMITVTLSTLYLGNYGIIVH